MFGSSQSGAAICWIQPDSCGLASKGVNDDDVVLVARTPKKTRLLGLGNEDAKICGAAHAIAIAPMIANET